MNGIPIHVAGAIFDNDSGAVLSASLILSPETAVAMGLLPPQRILIGEVKKGTIEHVASYLPSAIFPRDAASISVTYPPSPVALREELIRNSRDLINVLAILMIGLTFFTISTTMSIAVLERRKEIGLSLALGRSRLSISLEFLSEAIFLSIIGSLTGFFAAVLVSAAICIYADWIFILSPPLLMLPILGLVVGAIAGFWPTYKASLVYPTKLLRSN